MCNDIAIGNAQPIVRTVVEGSPPAPTGGTIVSGTYYATSSTVYHQSSQCAAPTLLTGSGTFVVTALSATTGTMNGFELVSTGGNLGINSVARHQGCQGMNISRRFAIDSVSGSSAHTGAK